MSVTNGLPVNAAICNAAFASRTVDTSLAGVVDLNNVTESTDLVTGGVRTLGGVAITKNLNVGGAIAAPTGNIVDVNATTVDVTTLNATDANVSDDLVVSGDTTVQLLDAVNVNTDDLLVNNDGTVTGDLGVIGEITVGGDSNLAIVNASDINTTGDVVIGGDLTVNGTITTVNTATLEVTDANILVNNGGNDTTAQGAGLTVERTTTNGALEYDSATASKFKIGNVGSLKEVATISDNQELINKTYVQPAVKEEASTPSTPASGYWKFYPKVDGFYQKSDLGIESKIGGSNSTSWVAYTPAFTGFGTVTNINVYSRREGPDLLIRGQFTAGTTTATTAKVEIGFNGTSGGLTIDSAVSPSSSYNIIVGDATTNSNLAGRWNCLSNITFNDSILFGISAGSADGLTYRDGSFAFASGTIISFMARVPITGWA